MSNEGIDYILRFLVGEAFADDVCSLVGYTFNPDEFAEYKVVIVPSPFFSEAMYGATVSLSALPLQEIEGVPLLYGSPTIERVGDTLVVYADIVASAWFLLTRYEEVVRRDTRDKHGRFPGRESLPFRAGFIDRPVVDEYGRLLRQWLRAAGVDVPDPEPKIAKVYLTHDIDEPFYCRTLRTVAKRTLAGENVFRLLKYYFGRVEDDPNFTFPLFAALDNNLRAAIGYERCQPVSFFKSGGRHFFDKPHYKIDSNDMQKALCLLLDSGATIGLHSGYDAGIAPSKIAAEKQKLEEVIGRQVSYNRHHFLTSREPEDATFLEAAGITDDFTMGYADVSGFRLGTSRPVRWIDPTTRRLSGLTLHPLTVMDTTLSSPFYMALNYDEALAYCCRLIEQTERMSGEVALLWHNDAFNVTERTHYPAWQSGLYRELLDILRGRF